MDPSQPGPIHILNLPQEVLVNIFLCFNARERLEVARTCTVFRHIIHRDPDVLRNLDFTPNGWVTQLKEIKTYFVSEYRMPHIRKVNISNATCMKPGRMLNRTVGRALNLVDVNIHGIIFENVGILASFLAPLLQLRRLVVDWPEPDEDVYRTIDVIGGPLGRLNYLGVRLSVYNTNLLPAVRCSCSELVEFRIVELTRQERDDILDIPWAEERPNRLQKLRIVQAQGWKACTTMKSNIFHMIPDLHQWTDFQAIGSAVAFKGFYLEKNVEICPVLVRTRIPHEAPYHHFPDVIPIVWSVLSESLLEQVIRMNHEDVPLEFCCLRRTGLGASANASNWPFILNIKEAKRLLKDPEYPITFLYLDHQIDPYCDAHLVVSAFPSLTDLILIRMITANEIREAEHRSRLPLRRSLIRRVPGVPFGFVDDPMGNTDGSFKLLVENTPLLRDLTIYYSRVPEEPDPDFWDLSALNYIPEWRHLTALRLAFVPTIDGIIFLSIGRQCPNLEIVVLVGLAQASNTTTYVTNLSIMLRQCSKIKQFSLEEEDVTEAMYPVMPGEEPDSFQSLELFDALACNVKLEMVHVSLYERGIELFDLVVAMENLLKVCTRLNILKYLNVYIGNNPSDANYVINELCRIRNEVRRPELQFAINYGVCYARPDAEPIVEPRLPDIIFEECPRILTKS
ncbi:uncharacterized protein LOC107216915 [Neodiprion lecontei]|uniref:Uncharacterized protein LOC107216915 n=1 Tax=Neodiprion lecontei TaxID=441921 RepID=A0A6J0B6E8_NEOLC|nr:uncharacterized protein LOC107216915 [Neodiprion lecontei]